MSSETGGEGGAEADLFSSRNQQSNNFSDNGSEDRNRLFETLHTVTVVYTWTIVTVGILGNLFSVFYLLCSRLKLITYYHYMASMCAADLMFLVLLMSTLIDRDLGILPNLILCPTMVFLTHVACHISVWSLAAATVERYIAIGHPYLKLRFSEVSKARLIIGAIVLSGIVFESWLLFLVRNRGGGETGMVESCDFGTWLPQKWALIVNMTEMTLSCFLALFVVIWCSLATIYALLNGRCAESFQSATREEIGSVAFTDHAERCSKGGAGSAKSATRRDSYMILSTRLVRAHRRRNMLLTGTIIAIALLHSFLNLQNMILRAYNTIATALTSRPPGAIEILEFTSFLLYYTKFAVNVVFFFLCPHRHAIVESAMNYIDSYSDRKSILRCRRKRSSPNSVVHRSSRIRTGL